MLNLNKILFKAQTILLQHGQQGQQNGQQLLILQDQNQQQILRQQQQLPQQQQQQYQIIQVSSYFLIWPGKIYDPN